MGNASLVERYEEPKADAEKCVMMQCGENAGQTKRVRLEFQFTACMVGGGALVQRLFCWCSARSDLSTSKLGAYGHSAWVVGINRDLPVTFQFIAAISTSQPRSVCSVVWHISFEVDVVLAGSFPWWQSMLLFVVISIFNNTFSCLNFCTFCSLFAVIFFWIFLHFSPRLSGRQSYLDQQKAAASIFRACLRHHVTTIGTWKQRAPRGTANAPPSLDTRIRTMNLLEREDHAARPRGSREEWEWGRMTKWLAFNSKSMESCRSVASSVWNISRFSLNTFFHLSW